jgi:hypothetical protein
MLREIVAVFAMLSSSTGHTTPVIDIVDIVPRNRIHEPATAAASGGRSGGDVGTSSQEGSVKIEILSANVANDTPEPTMIFKVRLRNTGHDKIDIPIDPNLADFEPADAKRPYSYVSAHVFVVLEETRGILQGVFLYGSTEIADSLTNLRSGESVEIRARTPLKPVNQNTISKVSAGSAVRAGFLMQQHSVSQQGGIIHEDSSQIAPESVVQCCDPSGSVIRDMLSPDLSPSLSILMQWWLLDHALRSRVDKLFNDEEWIWEMGSQRIEE